MVAFSLALAALVASVSAQHYTATYLPESAPPKSEQGQSGTNQCGTDSNQGSNCQNVYINSVEDFCIFAPPRMGSVGGMERVAVAYCMQPGHGTRLIPPGTISGAHFVQTPDYIQVTGVGDLTSINIPRGDGGGELDPHGADGNGNPIGGLVFGNSYGKLQQYHEWTNFIGWNEFCIRACKDGPNSRKLCQHIYDIMGCYWNIPGNYQGGVFEDCKGDTAQPMGIYGTSTFHQGDAVTPAPHPAPASSECRVISGTPAPTLTTTSTTSTTSASSNSTSSSQSVTNANSQGTSTSPSSPSATGTSSGTQLGSSMSFAVLSLLSLFLIQ